MQPLERTYIGYMLGMMQPVRDVVPQGRQYIIFSLNAGNGDTNEASSTGIWRCVMDHYIQKDNVFQICKLLEFVGTLNNLPTNCQQRCQSADDIAYSLIVGV